MTTSVFHETDCGRTGADSAGKVEKTPNVDNAAGVNKPAEMTTPTGSATLRG